MIVSRLVRQLPLKMLLNLIAQRLWYMWSYVVQKLNFWVCSISLQWLVDVVCKWYSHKFIILVEMMIYGTIIIFLSALFLKVKRVTIEQSPVHVWSEIFGTTSKFNVTVCIGSATVECDFIEAGVLYNRILSFMNRWYAYLAASKFSFHIALRSVDVYRWLVKVAYDSQNSVSKGQACCALVTRFSDLHVNPWVLNWVWCH